MDNLLSTLIEATSSFNIKIAFLIFIAYLITDAMYAKYTLDVANYNPFKAATTGSLIHFLLAFGVISYTQNWLYIFPLALGSWVGTFYLVKSEKLKNPQRNKINIT